MVIIFELGGKTRVVLLCRGAARGGREGEFTNPCVPKKENFRNFGINKSPKSGWYKAVKLAVLVHVSYNLGPRSIDKWVQNDLQRDLQEKV